MYNLAIRKCTSPPLLAPRLKISAEPEADMLPSELARRPLLSGRKDEISFHYWSFKYMNACLYMT